MPYVALVASPKWSAAVLASLHVTDEQRAVVLAPAGLDIGARTAEEIALSIYADLVTRRPGPVEPVGSVESPVGSVESVESVESPVGSVESPVGSVGSSSELIISDGRTVSCPFRDGELPTPGRRVDLSRSPWRGCRQNAGSC